MIKSYSRKTGTLFVCLLISACSTNQIAAPVAEEYCMTHYGQNIDKTITKICTSERINATPDTDWRKTDIPSRRLSFYLPNETTFTLGDINPTIDVYPDADLTEPRTALFVDEACSFSPYCAPSLSLASWLGHRGPERITTTDIATVLSSDSKFMIQHKMYSSNKMYRHLFYLVSPDESYTIQLHPDRPTQEQVAFAWKIISTALSRTASDELLAGELLELKEGKEMHPPRISDSWVYTRILDYPFAIQLPEGADIAKDNTRTVNEMLLGSGSSVIETRRIMVKGEGDIEKLTDSFAILIDKIKIAGTSREAVQALCKNNKIAYDFTKDFLRISKCGKKLLITDADVIYIFDVDASFADFTPFFDAVIKGVRRAN